LINYSVDVANDEISDIFDVVYQ